MSVHLILAVIYFGVGGIGFASWYEITKPQEDEAFEMLPYALFWPVFAVLAVLLGGGWCLLKFLGLPARCVMWVLTRKSKSTLPEARVIE